MNRTFKRPQDFFTSPKPSNMIEEVKKKIESESDVLGNECQEDEMKPVVVYQFELPVPITVPSNLKTKVLRSVNLYNTGKESVPLDEEWGEGKHGHMRDVHWNLSATHLDTITILVMSDGNLVIKKDENGQTA